MKLSWGWRIEILYSLFVLFMSTLVIASNHQHFDLVSKDYYEDEIAYQKVIDAGKNQSNLSQSLVIHADGRSVTIDFPKEFEGKAISGSVKFYCPVNGDWDRDFRISAVGNSFVVPRNALHDSRYTIKISCVVDSESYYQESEILLHS